MLRQDLDCDVAAQSSVPCFVHFTHAAGAEGRNDFVRAEFLAGRERHGSESVKFSQSEAVGSWLIAADGLRLLRELLVLILQLI